MNKKPTYIFFSNFLGFSGSEVLLKDLMNEIAERDDCNLVLVGYGEGELLPLFDKRIIYISFPSFYKHDNVFVKRQIKRFRKDKKKNSEYYFLKGLKEQYPEAVWVLNTLWLCRVLPFTKSEKVKCALWVHEMAVAYEVLDKEKMENLRTVPVALFCVSEAVAKSIRALNPTGRVEVVYPGIYNNDEIFFDKNESTPENVIRIGMSGRVDSNKNPLVILNLARLLKEKKEKRFKLLWIGGGEDNGLFIFVKAAIENEGLKPYVEFTGHLSGGDYNSYLSSLHLFFLTSNYDSFPLVMLEVSSLGIPIIAFASGGVSEFLEDRSCGLIMNDRSSEAIYKVLIDYYEGLLTFDSSSIIERCLYFSRERFVEHFYKLIKEI